MNALLRDASNALTVANDYRAAMQHVAELAVPELADLCLIEIKETSGSFRRIATAYAGANSADLLGRLERYSTDFSDPVPQLAALQTGQAVVLPQLSDQDLEMLARDEQHLALLRDLDLTAAIFVPLHAHNRTLGIVMFGASAQRCFSAEDVDLAKELALRTRLVLENVYLYEAERRARATAEGNAERMLQLQQVTAGFSRALTLAQVGEVVCDDCLYVLKAQGASLMLLNEHAGEVELLASAGFEPGDQAELKQLVAAGALPIGELAEGPSAVLLTSFDDLEGHYPALAPLLRRCRLPSMAVAPLMFGQRAIGAICFHFGAAQTFDALDRAFMSAMAHQCALTIERTRLYDAERSARTIAESVQRWLVFLAEASTTLASSVDYHKTVTHVLRRAVPAFADLCVFNQLEPDGLIRPTIVVASDALSELVDEIIERYPVYLDDPGMLPQVLRTGERAYYPDVNDAMLLAGARDAHHRQLLRAMQLRAYIGVPVIVGGTIKGVLAWASSRSGRRYNTNDLALAEELARRIGMAIDNARLYEAERHARSIAEEAVHSRDMFFSIAAHELRTPLTSLLGQTQLLQRRLEQQPDVDQRDQRAAQVVLDQANRLNHMITTLLDVSRIEHGQLRIERAPVDISALVRRVIDEVELTLERHTLACTLPEKPVVVEGDELRLEQVLQNLLSNAVKYSPGGEIEVVVERHPSEIMIKVADTGIGIPGQALGRVFQRFYRADNADQVRISGMGIGLYVVRQIVELHGGSVTAESTEGQGSIFTVRLPLARRHIGR